MAVITWDVYFLQFGGGLKLFLIRVVVCWTGEVLFLQPKMSKVDYMASSVQFNIGSSVGLTVQWMFKRCIFS